MTLPRIAIGAAVSWAIILPLAVANGLLRQFALTPWLGMRLAQPISGVLLMACIAVVAWVFVRRAGPLRLTAWLAVGVGWGLATFAFECLMLFMAGKGLTDLAAQYDFTDNNIWQIGRAHV